MKNDRALGLFITGTDTDIGKTYLARLLVHGFSTRYTVTYMKPVQTGCRRDAAGLLQATDFEYVMEGSGLAASDASDHVPYRFEPACSPHLAASRAGVVISLERIRERYDRLSSGKSVTIVEGAGGVCTPLSETLSMLDMIEHLGLPVVIATTPRVGTLNHTMLTATALRNRGIPVIGVAVNNRTALPIDALYRDTVRYLRGHLPHALFLEVGVNQKCTEPVKEFCHALFERL